VTEGDKIVRESLEAAKANRPEEALTLLEQLKEIDPKPLLYWYAHCQARLRQGEDELAYTCLYGFCAKLHAKHMELIGLNKSGPVDPKLLEEINGPLDIQAQRHDADAHRDRKEYPQAAECMSSVVMWRIDALKALGFDVFAE